MHMADALVAPAVAATMYACSAVAAGVSLKKVRLEEQPKKVPLMGIMGAFVFAAQMINFTIPGTGSSGHLAGSMLLASLMGPYAGFLTMIGVLLIQCLLFADGGLLALGCNVWNMAFYGCFVGALLIWQPLMRSGMTKKKIWIASLLGSILPLQLGAFSVVLETTASGITALPFGVFVAAMQPIHLAIGAVEGVITGCVLTFVYDARPELLWQGDSPAMPRQEGRLSYKKTLGVLAVAAAAVGGLLSLFASAFPDGLEWSIQRLTGSTELEAADGIHAVAAQIQEATALLPDYAFPGSDSAAGTSFSGLVGGAAVLLLCLLVCRLFRVFRGKKQANDE